MSICTDSEMTVATINAMRVQEKAYRVEDYLRQRRLLKEQSVDKRCRTRMVQWCYQVVDFCKFNRESVSFATSYVDRFLASGKTRVLEDRSMYQLTVMAALYTAVKIHEPEAMDPKVIATLSRGAFSSRQVQDMESKILHAIGWRMNPPTILSFCHTFLELLGPDVLSETDRTCILELATVQSELVVSEYELNLERPSDVAAAILLGSMDTYFGRRSRASRLLQLFLSRDCSMDTTCCRSFRKLQLALHDATAHKLGGLEHLSSSSTPAFKSVKSTSRDLHHSPRSITL